MFTYKNYTAKVEVDTETKRLRGRVLNINDAVHFEGVTVEGAEQDFHRAVENYLQLCQRSGKDPEKPFSGKLPFRTTPDVHRAIHQAAALEEKSINAWMEEVLGEAAKRSLKRQAEATPLSNSVQRLLDDRGTIAALVMQVSPYLASKAPRAMARVVDALEKLLIGLSEVKPFLKGEDPQEVFWVIREIESLATLAEPSPSFGAELSRNRDPRESIRENARENARENSRENAIDLDPSHRAQSLKSVVPSSKSVHPEADLTGYETERANDQLFNSEMISKTPRNR
ncbi:type II toxin-antitoxin system HicB family antitoxin [Phormidium tenue FACHB-886]|nr:type II toxin-antitoxin system HicB family antitoxin [Phormidium tenue FACHB-886]